MSESLTYQRQGAPTRAQVHTLFVPAEYEAVLRPLTETVESGNGSHPNGMVEQITGTPPRTFRDFARKNAAAWSEAAT